MSLKFFDVAIIGGGPAGSVCAALCARAGLQTVILEREKFPREKVCGDCLNPSCWPILERLELAQRVRALPHAQLEYVEFVAIDGRKVTAPLSSGAHGELSMKRSLFDALLLTRARELGAEVREETTVAAVTRTSDWRIETSSGAGFRSRVLVGADGRNSTVARLCNLLPRPSRERVALQAHIPLPGGFGKRVVLQFLPEGYSGQAPVNGAELNLCLVGMPSGISRLREWAHRHFKIPQNQTWRTVAPLARSAISGGVENLLLVGDAARVVEPFTGEGIYYALRSGELASTAAAQFVRSGDWPSARREFERACAKMYRGRLWINRLARAAVLRPRVGSLFVQAAQIDASILRLLTAKIVSASPQAKT